MDTDGCGEFKLITYLDEKTTAEQELNAITAKTAKIETVVPTLLDVKETAKLLKVSTRRIYSMRASGQIPLTIRLG